MKQALGRVLPLAFAVMLLANASWSQSAPPAAPGSGDEGRVRAMAVAPSLGAAGSFAVLGSSTVTNTGSSVVNGDLGVSPGNAVTGFPPGLVNGTTHAANATSLAAQNAATTAYNALTAQACDVDLSGQNLGGLILTPGTYCFSSAAQLTGTLTLNALGNAAAVWVFQIASTLTTASNSSVLIINGGQACGVFWQVGTSATLGTGTVFRGNLIALASITLNTGATSAGALFARTGAVTLDSNTVSVVGSCGPPVPTLPEVAAWVLLALLLASGAFLLGQRRQAAAL